MNWIKKLQARDPVDGDISLEDIGVSSDPGTEWRPKNKPLDDLSYDEVMEHLAKPERLIQPDAGLVLDHDGDDEGVEG